jgi:hypothetical protein
MAVGENGSPGEARYEQTRLARLSAVLFGERRAVHKAREHPRHGALDRFSPPQTQSSIRPLAEQDTRPITGKVRLNLSERKVSVVPIFAARNARDRMPTHQLLTWTQVDGHLALRREIPRGMALDLVLNGLKSEWRLVRGSCPRDEVLRGI